ncbi:MAG: MTH938/NDUFAF3 family protein [Pseudomonadota bacterium]
MQFQQDPNHLNVHVKSYQAGKIIINDQEYTENIAFSSEQILTDIPLPKDWSNLSPETIKQLCDTTPEVIIIGTGSAFQILPTKLLVEAAKYHLTLDVMDSAAACRTFTVLAAEGRKVVTCIFL